jgi:hypothetical protein
MPFSCATGHYGGAVHFGFYLIGGPSAATKTSVPIASPEFLIPFTQHAESQAPGPWPCERCRR